MAGRLTKKEVTRNPAQPGRKPTVQLADVGVKTVKIGKNNNSRGLTRPVKI